MISSSANIHTLIVRSRVAHEPRAAGLLADAHALGLTRLTSLEVSDLFFIEGDVSPNDLRRLAAELLSDPVAQVCQWRSVDGVAALSGQVDSLSHIIETALRPGVTDPVADQIVRCAKLIGVPGVERAATGQRFILRGDLDQADLQT